MPEILLDVQHLSHVFKLGKHAVIKAVDDVSFQMRKGEILASWVSPAPVSLPLPGVS